MSNAEFNKKLILAKRTNGREKRIKPLCELLVWMSYGKQSIILTYILFLVTGQIKLVASKPRMDE